MKALARASGTSTSRMIVELIELGLESRKQERERFLELADRLARSRDRKERKRLKEDLARITFGEEAPERRRSGRSSARMGGI